jgi:hypothetical protein
MFFSLAANRSSKYMGNSRTHSVPAASFNSDGTVSAFRVSQEQQIVSMAKISVSPLGTTLWSVNEFGICYRPYLTGTYFINPTKDRPQPQEIFA